MRLSASLFFFACSGVARAQHAGDVAPELVWTELKGACPAQLDWASLRGKVVALSLTNDSVFAGYSRGDPDVEDIRSALNHGKESGLADVPPQPLLSATARQDLAPSYEVHISPAVRGELRSLGEGGADTYVTRNQPLKVNYSAASKLSENDAPLRPCPSTRIEAGQRRPPD